MPCGIKNRRPSHEAGGNKNGKWGGGGEEVRRKSIRRGGGKGGMPYTINKGEPSEGESDR